MVQATYAASQIPVEGLPVQQSDTAASGTKDTQAITGQRSNSTKEYIGVHVTANRTAMQSEVCCCRSPETPFGTQAQSQGMNTGVVYATVRLCTNFTVQL